MKFEEALNKLEEIVEKLEKGDLPLEETIEIFEEGINISKNCSKQLNEAELRVKKLVDFDRVTH